MMPLFTTVLPITIIAASWITYCIMGIIWKKRDKKFIAFLTENADELLSGGGCEFEGVEYRRETRVDTLLLLYVGDIPYIYGAERLCPHRRVGRDKSPVHITRPHRRLVGLSMGSHKDRSGAL